MKLLKKIFLILLVLLVIAIIGGYLFLNSQKPNYSETVKLETISNEVDVHYDEYGIPHIYADNYKDAFQALGYVHAKDRLWQIELLRRIIPGRLSEMFGETSLPTDQFFRAMDLSISSKRAAERFNKEGPQVMKDKVEAYISGINHFIKHGPTPIEYWLLGLEKTEYTLEDMYNVMAYMSFSFAAAYKIEPFLSQLLEDHGLEYLQSLNTEVDTSTTLIEGYNAEQLQELSYRSHKALEGLPVPQLIGSNSWVLSPSKTTTGGVLFANDPHIGYAQPAVWFEAHMTVGDQSLYGNFVGGFPMPLVGNTLHHAIGLTMFANDDMDFYREKINPEDSSEYWHVDTWKKIESKEEIIKVKGGKDYSLQVERTVHGPIVSKFTKGMSSHGSIAMHWIYEKFPIQIVEACHEIVFSNSIEGVQKGVEKIIAPGLNVMYGDVDGNIAWWAAAKLPKRPATVNPKFILDGSTGKDDILEYYDFSHNPQSINPPEGYVYSANNQSVSSDGFAPWGYYQPEDRARRIRHLLDRDDRWTTDKMKEMILDVTSINDPEIVQQLIQYLETNDLDDRKGEVISVLEKWNGEHELTSIAPTIYYKWLYNVMNGIMSDEVEERFDDFLNIQPVKRGMQTIIKDPNSIWWDDVHTKEKEYPAMIVNTSLEKSISELEEQLGNDISQWQWSRVHTVEHGHAMGANARLKPYFNVGPFPVPGGREIINNYNFRLTGDGAYPSSSGPSCRRVINLNNLLEDNWSIIPTGQSGNRWSPHYKDQAEMYVTGKFRKQMMNRDEILENAKHHTTFLPK